MFNRYDFMLLVMAVVAIVISNKADAYFKRRRRDLGLDGDEE